MVNIISINLVKDLARENGLEVVGSTSVLGFKTKFEKHFSFLESWQRDGAAGEMQYMLREASVFKTPDAFLSGCRSILTFIVPYFQGHDYELSDGMTPEGFGKIARYAWGRDYHRVIKKYLKRFLDLLKSQMSGDVDFQARIFTDAVPLLERSIAEYARLGFIGKNTMLIRPGSGSYFFLAEVLLNIDIQQENAKDVSLAKLKEKALGEACGSCNRCIDQCPTKAIVSPGYLDARKCISYLTIEKRGVFSVEEEIMLGDWLFGCDVCQEVCPFNHRGIPSSKLKEFYPGVGPFLSLETLLQIKNKKEFEKMFSGTPLMRAGREGLLRNACAVVANIRQFALADLLVSLAKTDESAVVRTQARQSVQRLLPDADGRQKRHLRLVFDKARL